MSLSSINPHLTAEFLLSPRVEGQYSDDQSGPQPALRPIQQRQVHDHRQYGRQSVGAGT